MLLNGEWNFAYYDRDIDVPEGCSVELKKGTIMMKCNALEGNVYV